METMADNMMSSIDATDEETAFRDTVKSPDERPRARVVRLRRRPTRNILRQKAKTDGVA